jgi:riboflavin biosynthesis pyrimidine reductase
LREDGVSYVFAGPKGDDLPRAMEEINALFDVKTLLLEGGGRVNGAFLKHKLIDEFSAEARLFRVALGLCHRLLSTPMRSFAR